MAGPLAIPVDMQLIGEDAAEIAAFARAAEGAGIARLWATELYRSATIPLAVAAGATERIELGTGIALAFTRSPMVTALEALDLDDASGGRFTLGLGAGVRRLNASWHGAPYTPPVRRMREMVAAVRELMRALTSGRDARSEGRLYDIEVQGLRRAARAPRPEVPVWIAAVLPGMTRLAGQVADGFLDHPVTSPAWLREETLPRLRAGAERAGREMPEVGGSVICAASADDPEGARRAAAATVGFYAVVRTYVGMFSEHGFADRLGPIREAFLAGDLERVVEAVGPDMADAFSASGTPEQVREAARGWEGLADRLWVSPPHHGQSPAAVAGWQAGILEAFDARR
ncbi:MAG TPA: LLM class flavin-dependent oxidoreductase [Miltoncostaeaceae bacterium]|nr:LLM class flavin-dependent oxidoreductase [Miltoncostaeaceae bacterium]